MRNLARVTNKMAVPMAFSQFPPPPPPEDPEVRTIVDKLATFVARNGPEFERMTMQKQRGNPKFQFLFGGEHHPYYRWKVNAEQAAMYPQESNLPPSQGIPSLMSQGPTHMPHPSYAPPPPHVPSYGMTQPQNQPPVPQSGGVSAQPKPLIPTAASAPSSSAAQATPPPWIQEQQKPLIKELIHQLHQTRQREQVLLTQGSNGEEELEVEFSNVVKPVMESCTKDSISAGKGWIFSHSQSVEECNTVARYLMRKSLNSPGVNFTQKLHIIYLINDVIHHCLRKGAQDLKQAIQDIIIQIFYNAHITDPEKSDSLLKVLKIWENQKYFEEYIIQNIRDVVTNKPGEVKQDVATGASEKKSEDDASSRPWKQGSRWSQPQQQESAPTNWGPDTTSSGPPPWTQSKPTPLFPMSKREEAPPPAQEHVAGDEDYQGHEQEWQDGGSHDLRPTPLMSAAHQDDADVGIGESFDYNHQSHGGGEDRDAVVEGPREVFDYNHRSHDEMEQPWSEAQWGAEQRQPPGPPPGLPPGAHDQWGVEGPPPPPGSLEGWGAERQPPGPPPGPPPGLHDQWGVEQGPTPGPPPGSHDQWEHGLPPGPPPAGPPPDQWGPEPGGPPPPRSRNRWGARPQPPPPEMWEHGGPPMPPGGPPGMWGAGPPFPPPGPMGGPWDGPGPPDPAWEPPPPLLPPVPYFDLPAGIVVPLVPLHEHSYRPIRPKDAILPPPQPPTDHLLAAVEEFYKEETEETKRNPEGWEARALLGFFEAKRRAKDSINRQLRNSRRPPPRRRRSYSRSPRRRRRRSYSRSSSRSRSRSYSRSRSRSRSRSQSRSPRRRRRSSRSPSTDDSRSRSRSHSPARRGRRRSRSRSRSPFIPVVKTPPRRAVTPPGLGEEEGARPSFALSKTVDTKLEEDNMGHQILKRMGWAGSGLGAKHQGIEEPIKAAEARSNIDKYKGVGMDTKDPFETFRKNMSFSFTRGRVPRDT